jgi:hypothetical protein
MPVEAKGSATRGQLTRWQEVALNSFSSLLPQPRPGTELGCFSMIIFPTTSLGLGTTRIYRFHSYARSPCPSETFLLRLSGKKVGHSQCATLRRRRILFSCGKLLIDKEFRRCQRPCPHRTGCRSRIRLAERMGAPRGELVSVWFFFALPCSDVRHDLDLRWSGVDPDSSSAKSQ